MAASDYVLVPSRFEPCGLVAQAGARYGAVPIVAAVGGLKDLVTPEVCVKGFVEGWQLGGGQYLACVGRCVFPFGRSPAAPASARTPPPSRPPHCCLSCLNLPPHAHQAPQVGYAHPGFSHEPTAADHRQNVQTLLAVVRRAAAEYGTARYLALQQVRVGPHPAPPLYPPLHLPPATPAPAAPPAIAR